MDVPECRWGVGELESVNQDGKQRVQVSRRKQGKNSSRRPRIGQTSSPLVKVHDARLGF